MYNYCICERTFPIRLMPTDLGLQFQRIHFLISMLFILFNLLINYCMLLIYQVSQACQSYFVSIYDIHQRYTRNFQVRAISLSDIFLLEAIYSTIFRFFG